MICPSHCSLFDDEWRIVAMGSARYEALASNMHFVYPIQLPPRAPHRSKVVEKRSTSGISQGQEAGIRIN